MYHSLTYMQIILNMDKVYMILDEMIIEGYISETNQDRILAPLQLLDTVRKWYLSSNAADLTDVFTMNKGPLGSQEEVIEGSSWMYQNGNYFLRNNISGFSWHSKVQSWTLYIYIYSQTCIKSSPFGQGKSWLIRQMTS